MNKSNSREEISQILDQNCCFLPVSEDLQYKIYLIRLNELELKQLVHFKTICNGLFYLKQFDSSFEMVL